MREPSGTPLLGLALAAAGGLDRWSAASKIRFRLSLRGPSFEALGQAKTLDGVRAEVDVRRQHTIFEDFTGPGRHGEYTPDRVTVRDGSGAVLRVRDDPRSSFPPRDPNTRWDELHMLYFAGYAMWNYLTNPYLLTRPGVRFEEIEPSSDDGESWRRARVGFPAGIAAHNRDQIFCYDPAGRLRRMRYAPDVLGNAPVWHRVEGHRTFDGLVFPTRRRVFPLVDGEPAARPIILVDICDVSVEYAPGPR